MNSCRVFDALIVVSDFVGNGLLVRDGSPLARAAEIKVPVLLFHGGFDTNVNIGLAEDGEAPYLHRQSMPSSQSQRCRENVRDA